jgi:hypothetical protein
MLTFDRSLRAILITLITALVVTTSGALLAPAGAAASTGNLRTCASAPGGAGVALPDGGAWVDLASCEFSAPTAGTAVVYASAGAGHSTVPYVAAGRLRVDGVARPGETLAHILGTGFDYTGTDRSLALVDAIDVAAGTHTAQLQGQLREQTGGDGRAYYPSIWVLFVPNGSPVRVCSSLLGAASAPVQTLWGQVNSCTIDASRSGRIVSLWTGTPSFVSGSDFPVVTELHGPDERPITGTTRIASVVLNQRHAPIASTAMVDVAAGSHAVSMWTKLAEPDATNGSIGRSSLVSIYVPDGSARASACHSSVVTSWSLVPKWGLDGVYSAACTLTPTSAGRSLLVATAASGPPETAIGFNEARLRVLEDLTALPDLHRWSDTSGWAGLTSSGSSEVTTTAPIRYSSELVHAYGDDAISGLGGGVAGLFVAAPDTTAPTVRVTAAPAAITNGPTARIEFSSDADTSSTTCSIDGAAATPCSSPLDLGGLARGTHSVSIRATDDVGNVGAVASTTWRTSIAPVATALTAIGPRGLAAAARARATTISFRTAEPSLRATARIEVTAATARSLGLTVRRGQRFVVLGTASATTGAAGVQRIRVQLRAAAVRALARRAGARVVRPVPARVQVSLSAGEDTSIVGAPFSYRR